MHGLEYLRLLLTERIRRETGSDDLADTAGMSQARHTTASRRASSNP